MKNKYIKTIFLFLILIVLFVGITSVSANYNNHSSKYTQDTLTNDDIQTTSHINNKINQETKIIDEKQLSNISTNTTKNIDKKTSNSAKENNESTNNNDFKKENSRLVWWGYPGQPRIGDLGIYEFWLYDEAGNYVENQPIQFSCNNFETTAMNGGDHYYVYYTPDTLGVFNITLTYAGNDYYEPSTLQETIEVRKQVPHYYTSIDTSRIQLGDTIVLSGQFYTYDDALYFANRTVTTTFNNQNYTSRLSDEGFFTLNITPDAIGEYPIITTLEGDGTFDTVNSYDSVTVIKEKVTYLILSSEANYCDINEPAIIRGYLCDKNDTKIANQRFKVYFDGTEFNITSDDNGDFVFNLTSNKIEQYYVTFNYEGSEEYSESSNGFWISFCELNDTQLTIDSITPEYTDTIEYGSYICVNGTLTDSNGNPIQNEWINCEDTSAQTDENGKYSINLYLRNIGSYNLTTSFRGSETYKSANATKNILINKGNIGISLNYIPNVLVNNPVNFTGSYLPGVNLTIVVNNETVATIPTEEYGLFSYEYLATIGGENILTVIFEGNDYYTPTEVIGYFFVDKKYATLTVEPIETVEVGNNVIITGKLTSEEDPIPNANISLIISDETFNTTTDANGIYTYEYPALFSGDYNIRINYEGDNAYYDSYEYDSFSITDSREYTGLYLNPIDNQQKGSTVEISGTGYNIINENVSILFNNKTFITTLDEDGYFKYNLTVDNTGEQEVIVVFEGNQTHQASRDKKVFTVFNTKIVYLNASINQYYVDVGETPIVNGTLIDTQNKTIPNQTIIIKYDHYDSNVHETTVTTDNDGYFVCELPVNETGDYRVSVIFEETDEYAPTSRNFIFTIVERKETIINITNISSYWSEFTYDSSVTVYGKITDIDGNPLPYAYININGESFEIYEESFEYYGYPLNKLGNLSITVNYSGDEKYKPSSCTKVIQVVKSSPWLYLDVSHDTISVGNQVSLYISFKENTTLNIKINNKTVDTIKMDFDMEYYHYNTTIKDLGENNITVEFEGNEYYNPAENTVTFKVITYSLTLEEIPSINYGETVDIKGKLLNLEDPVANAEITLSIIGENFTVSTDKDGLFTLTYQPVATGEIGVTAEYYYENNSSTYTYKYFYVYTTAYMESYTHYTIPDTTFEINDVLNISGAAYYYEEIEYYDEYGNSMWDTKRIPISNTNIIINYDGKNYTVKTDNDGQFNHTITLDKLGEFNIRALYPGNETITPSYCYQMITVNKKDIKISINPITGKIGQTIDLTATLKDKNQNNITEGKVIFKINNETLKDKNNKILYVDVINGKATTKYTIPESLYNKNNTLKVIFNETDKINESQNITSITVIPRKMNVTINELKPVREGSDIQISITAKYEDGKPVNNGQFTLIINGKELKDKNNITNGQGSFTYHVNIPKGTYNLSVTANSPESTGKTSTTLTVLPLFQNTKITITKINTTVYNNDITITGKLTTLNNTIIPKANVTIKINGQIQNSATDNKGVYTYVTKATTIGTNKIEVSYNGNENYNTTSNTTTFHTIKSNVKVTVDPVNGIIGENIILTAHIVDEKGNPVNGGNLVFKLNGKTLRTDGRFDSKATSWKFKVENGKVTVTIKADLYLRNAKNLTASYSGTYRYNEAKSKVVTAQIKKRNAKLTLTINPKTQNQYKTITFTAKLSDTTKNHKNNTALYQGTKILFKINDVTIKSKKGNNILLQVDKNGNAIYNYTIPKAMGGITKDGKTRNYKVTAILISDTYYPDTKDNQNFTVKRSPVTINITKATVNKNNQLSIRATLKDYKNNKLIGNNLLSLKINGKSLTNPKNNKTRTFTAVNGTIKLDNIQINKNIKIKKVMIVTGARQAYLGQRNETTNIIKA